MKKLFFSLAWVLLSTGVTLTSISAYYFFILHKNQPIVANIVPESVSSSQESIVEIKVVGNVKGIETDMKLADARAEIVAEFLKRHNSPLEPHDHFGEVFVSLADEYEFDFRLLPAIAMQESNLCNKIPAGSYNCLGFGIHERGTLGFESFEANFERAARELKKYYIDIGLDTPELIMTKYTPFSDGSWAESVKQWMSEMKYNDYVKGKELKEDNPSVLEYANQEEIL
ncbi:MAG: hypothetical protein ABFQ62_00725 [Patescibacteria group bacterium]